LLAKVAIGAPQQGDQQRKLQAAGQRRRQNRHRGDRGPTPHFTGKATLIGLVQTRGPQRQVVAQGEKAPRWPPLPARSTATNPSIRGPSPTELTIA